MEKYLRRRKNRAEFKGLYRIGGSCLLLPVLFLTVLLSGCEPRLKEAYNSEESLQRMRSLTEEGTEQLRADSFARSLAVPGVTDFNSEEMSAPSYALMDISGAVHPDALAYQKPYMRVYPASITKLMTALVCLQNVRDLEQEFTVTENSVIRDSGSSLAQLHPGDRISIRNLLYGMLLPSGNDAAVAVAEATAGSIPRFVVMMNEEALRLGCTGTHFVNPHGLPDDNHFTTAYDIYLILREVMKYDEFRDIVSKRDYSVSYQDKNGHVRTQKWEISNRYLLGEEEIPGGLSMLGGKTGTTLKAGYCLALAVRKDDSGKEYISIVMKSKTKDELYQNMSALLEKIH